METVFRKAVPGDAPQMAALITLAWQKAYRGILSDALLDGRSAAEGAQRIREGMETRPEFDYYVLTLEQRVTGVSVVCPSNDADLPQAAAIQVFYIHPDFQRQGLGRSLMRHTLAAIRQGGAHQILLWVLTENHSARAFYEAAGFTADGAEKTLPSLENAHTVRYQYQMENIV